MQESMEALADLVKPGTETEAATNSVADSLGLESFAPKETPKEEVKPEAKADEGKTAGDITEVKAEGETTTEATATTKDFWDDDEATTESKPNAEDKPEAKDSKRDIDEDVLKKAGAYESIVSDPIIDAYLSIKTSGKDIKEFISLLSTVDPKTMTPEQLYKHELSKEGLTSEEIEIEMARFEEQSPYQKKLLANKIAKDIEAENAEKLNRFKANTDQERQSQEKAKVENLERLDKATKDAVGQEWFGLKITEEMAIAAKDGAINQYAVRNQDGSYNMEESLKANIKLKYFNTIVKTAVTAAKNKTKEEMLKQVSNPSLNETNAKPVTANPNEDAKKQAVNEWLTQGIV